jgi:hypothetical protein
MGEEIGSELRQIPAEEVAKLGEGDVRAQALGSKVNNLEGW